MFSHLVIFKLGLHSDRRMMLGKFPDDFSNGSGVFMLTDKHTKSQTDITVNYTTIATLSCADGSNGRPIAAKTMLSAKYLDRDHNVTEEASHVSDRLHRPYICGC